MPLCSDAAQAQAAWARAEPAFVPVDALCPSLAALLAVRQTVGLRNPGHTLAKLLAPQPRSLRVVSHTHPEYATLLQQFLMHSGAHAMLLRGTEGEAVADARRCPQLQVFVAGQARCELSRQAQGGSLNSVPDWPAGHDAASTAGYIDDVMAGRKPLPLPIAVQLDSLKRTLLALPAGRPMPAA
jgi:anthranilate phosphoribosyltransferase